MQQSTNNNILSKEHFDFKSNSFTDNTTFKLLTTV